MCQLEASSEPLKAPTLSPRHVNRLYQREIMNSSPFHHVDLEPLRCASKERVEVKSFDVSSNPCVIMSPDKAAFNPKPNTSTDSGSEHLEMLKKSMNEVQAYKMVRQQSLTQINSKHAECSDIAWFRHSTARSLKRSLSVGCCAPDQEVSVPALHLLPLSISSVSPPPSIALTPEKSTLEEEENVRPPLLAPASPKPSATRSPKTRGTLTPGRTRHLRLNKNKLSRTLSTPHVVTSFSPKPIQRTRTAPTSGSAPTFNWETYASKKSTSAGKETASRNHVQDFTTRQRSSLSRRNVKTSRSPPRSFQPQVGPVVEEEVPSTSDCKDCDDHLNVFDWERWAKTQSRRPETEKRGRRQSVVATGTRRKIKRSSDPAPSLKQRRVKSERNLTSRRSSCFEL